MSNSQKTHIKVFVTKNMKFRARINEPELPAYEVTVGSKGWEMGKGRKHEAEVMQKICKITDYLLLQRKNIFLKSSGVAYGVERTVIYPI